jgi:hypothetical protein
MKSICYALALVSVAGMHAQKISFSQEAVGVLTSEHGTDKVPMRTQPVQDEIVKPSRRRIPVETLESLIDMAACLYAAVNIIIAYKAIGLPITALPVAAAPTTYWGRFKQGMIDTLFPTFLKPESVWMQRGRFMIQVGGIAIETLVYKTMAQLVLMCATQDVGELAQKLVVRLKKLIRAFMPF